MPARQSEFLSAQEQSPRERWDIVACLAAVKLPATGKIAAGAVPTRAVKCAFEVWCTPTCIPRTATFQRMSADAGWSRFFDPAPATNYVPWDKESPLSIR